MPIQGDAVNDSKFVRELLPEERAIEMRYRTGDRLPDGSVLLVGTDMDRMGLRALREWIDQKVVREHTTIALGTLSTLRQATPDEIV